MSSDIVLMMVTYNRLDLLKQTLNHLYTTLKSKIHFVVVDNGSTDGTKEFWENYSDNGFFESIDLILLEENKGIAIGRNLALKKANEYNPNWYVTIDPDVEMPEGWLEECIDILSANIVFGAIGVNFESRAFPIVTKNGKRFQEKRAGNLGTAGMCFRKQVHKMLGYFNTEYGKYGEEDADYGMRIRVAGFKMGYIERMGVHLGADESDKNQYRIFKTEQHAKNLALFHKNCILYSQRQKPIMIPFVG